MYWEDDSVSKGPCPSTRSEFESTAPTSKSGLDAHAWNAIAVGRGDRRIHAILPIAVWLQVQKIATHIYKCACTPQVCTHTHKDTYREKKKKTTAATDIPEKRNLRKNGLVLTTLPEDTVHLSVEDMQQNRK